MALEMFPILSITNLNAFPSTCYVQMLTGAIRTNMLKISGFGPGKLRGLHLSRRVEVLLEGTPETP